MEIRKKLTLRFVGIVAIILTVSSISIYVLFARYRTEEFYGRLQNKAILLGQMVIDIEAIDMEVLKKIEKKNPLTLSKEKIVIYNENKEIIYSTDDANIIHPTSAQLKSIAQKKEWRYRHNEYEIIAIYYENKDTHITVFAAAVDIYGVNKLNSLRNILILVLLTCLAAVYWAGRFFATNALAPIVHIVEKVDKIGVLNLNARIEEGTNNDELSQLARTFNNMLQRIEEAFRIQKNFIANASHELRVPLTVISGQLEVILMNKRTAEEYERTIKSVLDDMHLLNHLANRLLLLAQASSDFAGTDFEMIRVDEVFLQACIELQKHKPEYKVQISFSEQISEEQDITILGSELLLKTAIYNLLDNGCKYSKDHSVLAKLELVPDGVLISVKDEGIGIPEKEQKLIFQPFYRAGNSLPIRGHGIGLSLAEKIILLHKGRISLQSELGKGSTFSVFLPTKKD